MTSWPFGRFTALAVKTNGIVMTKDGVYMTVFCAACAAWLVVLVVWLALYE
jgi:hypothetical protein